MLFKHKKTRSLKGPALSLPSQEMVKDCAANSQTRRYVVRPTCNQKSVSIEDLVAQRRAMHLMMLKHRATPPASYH